MLKTTALLLSLGAAVTLSTTTPALAQTPAVQPAAHPASCPAVLKHTFNRLQDEAPQDYQEAPPASQPPPQAAAAPTSEADRVGALRDLKELLDSGAISQVEFDKEKNRLLEAGR